MNAIVAYKRLMHLLQERLLRFKLSYESPKASAWVFLTISNLATPIRYQKQKSLFDYELSRYFKLSGLCRVGKSMSFFVVIPSCLLF